MNRELSEAGIVVEEAQIESIFAEWRQALGAEYAGYRGHVYRVFNCCLRLRDCDADERRKLAIALVFHDIGLWSARTLDYLPPSEAEAVAWLARNGLAAWSDEIAMMIRMHHRIRHWRDPATPLVETLRRADLIDFSLGAYSGGLPRAFLRELSAAIPNAGFHRFLLRAGFGWFLRHPLRPTPFLRW
ncbi:MAG: hypothetical protein E6Q88_05700 [Lysobacteraceae bacterium]|nr:MAG: hypothetical protein E6Q88_05700 [Xanthomonadaceae bacterium]